jgi:hypothetical protein
LTPSTASTGRIAQLLRWLGLTLVVLMGLQLTPLLVNWNWDLEAFRQVFLDRLVGEGPMALVGLLLMLVAQRVEGPSSRTPLRWLVGVLAALLAIAMVVAVPLSLSSEAAMAQEAQQQEAAIAQQAMQVEMQKQQIENPGFVDQLIAEAEKEGRIPPQATDAEKKKRAREFIDTQIRPQLEQAEKQVAQARFARNLGLQQRRFGVTGRAAALAVAFVLVAVVALV